MANFRIQSDQGIAHYIVTLLLFVVLFGAAGAYFYERSQAATVTNIAGPTAVKGFDEAGVSTGIGNDFSPSQWIAIKNQGYRLFITDPISWKSECSDGNCTKPLNKCIIDAAAVEQIQDARKVGMDYAVYTRNPNCLAKAISGLNRTLQAHLSFAVLDIETGPSVKLTSSLINSVTALDQTPVIYSYQGAWQSLMDNSTAYNRYALQDGEVPSWNVKFPSSLPANFPNLVNMPKPYGGWSGRTQIEQQQTNVEIGNINKATDSVDIDSVNAAWLSSLPHRN